MTAANLILALGLAVSQPLADAIDRVCPDLACRMDAVTTCYLESRCQMNICRKGGTDCGPFQQIARYADHPELEGLSTREIMERLNTDPVLATEQWLRKRDRYARTHGDAWPRRYNGSARAEQYLINWRRVRARLVAGVGR